MSSLVRHSEKHRVATSAGERRGVPAGRLRVASGLLLAALSGSALAQSFTENFDDVSQLAGSGWLIQNNSSPLGPNSWYQGIPTTATPDPGPFNAYNGAPNAYIAANFAATTGGNGTISDWLVAPNRTFRNGDVFTFYTRKPTILAGQTDYPDRLEVRLSTNGASTNVGSGAAAVGDFTTLMLSINPTLTTNVYPQVWTQYTITMSGLPAPTSGRLAFRYFVTGAGPSGVNSDYIGVDNVVYTPYVCPAFTISPSTLPGASWGQAYSQSLSQTGALGAPNFALTAGALPPGLTLAFNGTISGSPTTIGTFNFTVTANDASGCSGSQPYSITVVPVLPAAPGDVSAVAGDGAADVTWTAPANDGGDSISGYTATCTNGTDSASASGPTPPITVGGLVNGTAYTCTVAATNSVGTGAASAPSNAVTPMGNQTISFGPQPGRTYSPGGTFAIDPPAIASSGLAVTYGSATPGVCMVSGATVSIVAAGTCTITADQPGDVAWNPAPQVSQPLVIAQATQTLTFPAQTEPTRWFHAGSTFAIAPLATSDEPNSTSPILYGSLTTGVCTVGGTTVTMVSAGSCVLAANKAGDGNYTAAPQAQSTVELVEPTQADLWIEKTADASVVNLGDTITYTILVGNDGPADAVGVRVLDLPPERLDAATVTWQCVAAVGTSCPSPASGTGTLDAIVASLPVGAAVHFELSGELIAAADPADEYTPFTNTASVALPQGSSLTDPPGNNQSTATVREQDLIFADGFEEIPLQ